MPCVHSLDISMELAYNDYCHKLPVIKEKNMKERISAGRVSYKKHVFFFFFASVEITSTHAFNWLKLWNVVRNHIFFFFLFSHC